MLDNYYWSLSSDVMYLKEEKIPSGSLLESSNMATAINNANNYFSLYLKSLAATK